jgi:hypothetical protein
LLNKQKTGLERLAIDKHSSLLQKFVNCGQKSFMTLGPGWGRCYITIFLRYLIG